MAILGFEGVLIFTFLALIYNISMTMKLIFNSLTNEQYDKIVWNLLSSAMMGAGTLLLFFWFFQSFTPKVGWYGFAGSCLILINNITATILAFMNRIKASIFGKIVNVFLSLLAIATFFFFLNKIAAQTAFNLPGFLEWIVLIPTIGYAMFQSFVFSQSSYFFPALILLPLCVPIKFVKEEDIVKTEKIEQTGKPLKQEKTSDSKSKETKRDVFLDELEEEKIEKPSTFGGIRKFLDNGSKGIYCLLIIFLLVFNILGFGVMMSFNPFLSDYQPSLVKRSDFEFGVTINTITYDSTIQSDYEELFNKEIELLLDLQVTTVRLDVNYEIINKNSSVLKDITDELHSNGFKVMLVTYGYSPPTWQFLNVSFSTYTETIENQSIELIQLCDPEYILIYPEPLTLAPYYLNEEIGFESWVEAINDTSNTIHSLTNETKVGVSLVINIDHPNFINELFEPLWMNSTLDLIGLDLYPLRGKYLDLDGYFAKMTNSTKEFWLTEFGISPVTYGEARQSGTIARMLEICLNDNRIKGFIYFTLIDYSAGINSLGLVAETGHVRKAFTTYKDIINYVTS